MPFSIFRIEGLAAADATQVIAQAGFLSMFFFITLYMQNVLGYSPIAAGTAYLPVTVGVGIAAGISTGLVARIGTRPIIVAGAVIGAGGVYWLSRIPVHGSYLTDLLPGLVVMALGLGAVMVGVQNAANAGVPADKAGLAAALITTSSTVGAALGLAILTAIATSRTNHLIAAHASTAHALTGGFHAALVACSAFLVGAAVIAARATNTRGQQATGDAPQKRGCRFPKPRDGSPARRRCLTRRPPAHIAGGRHPSRRHHGATNQPKSSRPTTRLSTVTHNRPIKARRSGALRRPRFAETGRWTPPANSLRYGAPTRSCLGRPAILPRRVSKVIARKTCFARPGGRGNVASGVVLSDAAAAPRSPRKRGARVCSSGCSR